MMIINSPFYVYEMVENNLSYLITEWKIELSGRKPVLLLYIFRNLDLVILTKVVCSYRSRSIVKFPCQFAVLNWISGVNCDSQ